MGTGSSTIAAIVVVIDEAHLLDNQQMEAIRMLTNHDMDSGSPFAALLIGQPTLRHRLRRFRAVVAKVILFLAYTGLRWGEMAALKVGRFDMLRRRVSVTEAVAEVHGQLTWDSPKTHERRSVPFPAFLAAPLATLMEGRGRDDLMFAGPKGATLRVSTFRPRVFAHAIARCRVTDRDFPMITPYDLRHTAASLAISAGANVKAVQTMLGDKSSAMTLHTYADLFPGDLDAVVSRLYEAARPQSVSDFGCAEVRRVVDRLA